MKYLSLLVFIFVVACNGNKDENAETTENTTPPPPSIGYSILNVFPHDTSSYTQGLEFHNNELYEGTGLEEKSHLMKMDLATGKAKQKIAIPKVFGEGITILNNKIYQLTYTEHKVFVYDLATFKKIQEFEWPYQGWGLTHIGNDLVVSTGSNSLYYVDPSNFKIKKVIGVTDNNGPLGSINELEYINGSLFANIYETTYIVKINPETGKVEGRMDLGDIFQKANVPPNPNQNVLNGIAYDSAKNSLYVTGKWWPNMFEIRLN
jgi:glutamine cyclotransferase